MAGGRGSSCAFLVVVLEGEGGLTFFVGALLTTWVEHPRLH